MAVQELKAAVTGEPPLKFANLPGVGRLENPALEHYARAIAFLESQVKPLGWKSPLKRQAHLLHWIAALDSTARKKAWLEETKELLLARE